jgi:UDP-glucose 4-epimerase
VRVAVLGGSGYIGRHLVPALVEEGAEVTVLSRNPSRSLFASSTGIRCIEGSFLEQESLRSALVGADCVIHLVSCTNPRSSNEDRVYDAETNIIGSVRLLDECLAANVRRVVVASSGGTIYGVNSAELIPEEAPTNPICAYGISKLAIEKYLFLYHHQLGLDYSALRLANPYGGDQSSPATIGVGAITAFFDRIVQGRPIDVWGDGQVVRDYVHVADVVSAFVAAAFGPSPNAAINIGTGEGISLIELIEAIGSVVGKRPIVHYSAARAVDVPRNVLDVTRACALLGWRPSIRLDVGLGMINSGRLRMCGD